MSRRSVLQVGALGSLGLSQAVGAAERDAGAGGSAKSCIYLFLWGGPSQLDTWDMKPDAPAEIRGDFRPVPSAVPGMPICEHLPQMGRLAKHYAVVRSIAHNHFVHQPAGGTMLTGDDQLGDPRRQAPRLDDTPAMGTRAAALAPGRGGLPGAVMMPARLADGGFELRGQNAGWLGSAREPLLVRSDPNAPNFRVDGFSDSGVSPERLRRRRELLTSVERQMGGRSPAAASVGLQEQVFELLLQGRAADAFNLSREPDRTRDRYGRNQFGQCCLLARRLVESGARMVTVAHMGNFPSNSAWDTHSKNFSTLKDLLLPTLDQAYSALLEDLIARGMLEQTVVYVGGEFGRAPLIGKSFGDAIAPGGRDHWPYCFSGVLAGGLTRGGAAFGASDSRGYYPTETPVRPADMIATVYGAMGLDPSATVRTYDGRPMPIAHGRPLRSILL